MTSSEAPAARRDGTWAGSARICALTGLHFLQAKYTNVPTYCVELEALSTGDYGEYYFLECNAV
jgi:hypothetical protein